MNEPTSRMSKQFRVVVPLAVRDALQLRPGDQFRYRLTRRGVTLERVASDLTGPFMAFTEWASQEDEEAFHSL